MFLLSYKNTHESLGELEKTVHFALSETSTRVSIKQLDYELEILVNYHAYACNFFQKVPRRKKKENNLLTLIVQM